MPVFVLHNRELRQKAMDAIRYAKPDAWVTIEIIEGPKRSAKQNRHFHGMCHDLSAQVKWTDPMGRIITMSPESWKLFMKHVWREAFGFKSFIVPNPEGTGFYDLQPVETRKMKVGEMADLITLTKMFGDQRQVRWSEPEPDDRRGEE